MAPTDQDLDTGTTCRAVSAGPIALPNNGLELASGQTVVHADVDPPASQPGGSSDLLSPRVQDSRNHTLAVSHTEIPPLPVRSLQRYDPPVTTSQSMLHAVPDQLDMPSPPQAALQSQASDAPLRPSSSRHAGMQPSVPAPPQPQPAPSTGGGAAELPPLPRLPAVTSGSLPTLAEVLAPVAMPAASALIGADTR